MQKKGIIAIVAFLIAGIAFYGGTQFQKLGEGKLMDNRARGQLAGLPGAGSTRNPGGSFTSGEIIGADAESVTLKMPNGATKIVFYSGSTSITKQTAAVTADLQSGETITVSGANNPDGSISAQNISIGRSSPFPPKNSASSGQQPTPNLN